MTSQSPSLAALKRPSGALAMLAVDQREALRQMMSQAQDGKQITDEEVIAFKLAAAKALTPYASAVLIDNQFALQRAVDEGVVDPSCALIASADLFIPEYGELVGDVDIDPEIPPATAKALGAVAQKLLVIWRSDLPAEPRIELVDRFIAGCREAGLISIIEPVCKKPADPANEWTWEQDVLTAAKELGSRGADLYKGEVPFHGKASDEDMLAYYRQMNEAISSEWVCLSSGVAEADFPHAVELAVEAGASGFLAGRAVWASCIESDDVINCLNTAAVERLQAMGEMVDAAMARRDA